MAFVRRQASSKRGGGVVLWDDWTTPQRDLDQPQSRSDATLQSVAQPVAQVQALTHSSRPATAGAMDNRRASTAKAAYAAMERNFASPTTLPKGVHQR